MSKIISWCILASMFFSACSSEDFTPKPHGYPRIDFPEKTYKAFTPDCGFAFDVPVYSTVTPDSSRGAEPCWYNINYTPFNATLHLSYKDVPQQTTLDSLISDSYTLVYKHSIKAEDIVERYMAKKEEDKYAIIFDLSGNTATSLNFHVTDSSKHFIRGALYFNSRTEVDSIAPVLHFLRDDVLKLIESLTWKE